MNPQTPQKTTEKPTHCTACGKHVEGEFRRSKRGRKLYICRPCSRKEDKALKSAA